MKLEPSPLSGDREREECRTIHRVCRRMGLPEEVSLVSRHSAQRVCSRAGLAFCFASSETNRDLRARCVRNRESAMQPTRAVTVTSTPTFMPRTGAFTPVLAKNSRPLLLQCRSKSARGHKRSHRTSQPGCAFRRPERCTSLREIHVNGACGWVGPCTGHL